MAIKNGMPNAVIVAPFTGAWIEITAAGEKFRAAKVAPFTGAWIEISTSSEDDAYGGESHPSRVRGLKCKIFAAQKQNAKSHPSRVRGLKLKYILQNKSTDNVAPFTGAWIEITLKALECSWGLSRTLHGCVD